MGRLKLNFQDLFYLEVSDLNLLIKGHEIDKRDDWERSRWQSNQILLPYAGKKSDAQQLEYFKLPWDKKIDKMDFIERAKILTQKLKARDNVKVRD